MSSEDTVIEEHEKIKQLTSNWKLISIITVFINRNILSKANLESNLDVEDKKPVLIQSVCEPVVLNVSYVDTYNINLFKEIHNSIDLDLQYLRSNPSPPEPATPVRYDHKLLDTLLVGLTTINEHLVNYISYSYENLYDQKIKKVIEYFIQQREYYLSIGRVKLKA
jgi:hypothetical protein